MKTSVWLWLNKEERKTDANEEQELRKTREFLSQTSNSPRLALQQAIASPVLNDNENDDDDDDDNLQ